MKIPAIFLLVIAFSNAYAQKPPKWQAESECAQAKQLSEKIAELKNQGATKSDIKTVVSMSSDGAGIMGDLALVFFDLHKKGNSPAKFSVSMNQRCMRSNGY